MSDGGRVLAPAASVTIAPTDRELIVFRRADMKRNMDIVRKIALEAEKLEAIEALHGIDGVDPASFSFHVIWMEEAGLVKAVKEEYVSQNPPRARVLRLTWEGCDFLDSVRDETLWGKAKKNIIKPSASFTFGILKDWLGAEIRNGLPTLRG
jgi:DNA-binding transcriptional ArsR family regulator